CGGGAAGTLTGHVRNADTHAAIANVQVQVSPGGSTAFTDANGFYTQSVTPGTYSLTATKANYSTGSASGLVVTDGGTTPQDFDLTYTKGTIAGHVRNASTNAPIAGATVTTTGPEPGTATTDVNGLYTRDIAPATYSLTAQ